MKKGKTLPPVEQKDVFSRYRLHRIHEYLFSGVFAFVIAFSIVSAREGVDVRQFLANVAEVQTVSPQLDADLVARLSSTGTLDIIVGNTLESPKTLELSLLGDPARFSSLRGDSENISILSESEGVYHVQINLSGEKILPNTPVARLFFDGGARTLSLVDTEFTTVDSTRYALSNSFEE